MEPLFLTRTRYLNGFLCPKMLWLRVNQRDRFPDPKIREAAIDNSKAVQELARGLFPDGMAVAHEEYAAMRERTLEILRKDSDRTIFHAVLSFQNCFSVIDILHPRPDGSAEIYMVKAAVRVSEISREDLAYQYYVCRMAGIRIAKAAVLTVSRSYVRGDEIEVQQFFRETDLTKEMEKKFPAVRDRITALRIYTAFPRLPQRKYGEGCFSPYDCSLIPECMEALPEPNVFQLSSTPLSDRIRFYEEGRIAFSDFAKRDREGKLSVIPGLSASASLQVLSELEKRPLQADRGAVREFLRSLWKPLYYLDFEAFQPVVPLYRGTKPFETIVFQYSLHKEDEGTVRHTEYLGDPSEDPRRELSERLISDIPENACILTYNSSYEKKRIAELAELFPEYGEALMKRCACVMDLMPLFRDKQVYDRAMQGSYSLKAVLPALFPEDPSLNYRNLSGVSSGSEAADAFLMLLKLSPEEKEKLKNEMLRYCEMDTLAMVKIVELLRRCAEDEKAF